METSLTQYSLIKDIVYTDIDDDIVVLNSETGHFYAVNSVGVALWHLLEKTPLSVENMVTHLKESYILDELEATRDITLFLQSLDQHGFLTTHTIE